MSDRRSCRDSKMSIVSFVKPPRVSKAWIALRRLDKNDDRVVALREVSIPPAAEVDTIIQIITTTFGLNSSDVIFKIRNHRGCLIPLNSLIPANSKHMPYVLEVAKIFQHDDRVVALREVSIPPAAEVDTIIQIITTTFGLNSSDVIFKIRNHRGCLIPLNSLIPANSKHMPYVLEVAKIFQHDQGSCWSTPTLTVRPKPRTIPMNVINKSMRTRLQTIDRRIQRLEELLPQIKLRRREKLSQEIECLNQKLRFLHKRMQVADSRSWKGVLTRAPLW